MLGHVWMSETYPDGRGRLGLSQFGTLTLNFLPPRSLLIKLKYKTRFRIYQRTSAMLH